MLSIFQGKEHLAPAPQSIDLIRSLVGGTLSILILIILSKLTNNLFIMAPFGATCVLLYAVSQSPLAQPRNVILGHFISAFIGLLFLKLFGINTISIALSVGCAIAAMQLLRCVHPPAGANPLVILLTANTIEYHWSFLFSPVLFGATSLVLIAWLVNNLKSENKWPIYGLALIHSKKTIK
ncbi:HPP family protein [Acinetobacter modestus]|uniref:HPP family protein n=1 Tax=Acinetobacter modestus TaxID=1776740 RepID=UPI001F4B4509|nr:HPP family protein [Acinetobacter modestus]MCH7388114.1 HPP family protein [Acinetobacter modestus]